MNRVDDFKVISTKVQIYRRKCFLFLYECCDKKNLTAVCAYVCIVCVLNVLGRECVLFVCVAGAEGWWVERGQEARIEGKNPIHIFPEICLKCCLSTFFKLFFSTVACVRSMNSLEGKNTVRNLQRESLGINLNNASKVFTWSLLRQKLGGLFGYLFLLLREIHQL